MTPTISMSVFRRPEYTRIVCDALRDCIGSQKYRLVVAVDRTVEGVDQEVLSIVRSQTWPADLEVHVMPKPAGANGTIRAALAAAFARSDYVVHVEDDVELSRDALAWFEWAGRQYASDPQIFTVSAWRHPEGWQPDSPWPLPPDEFRQCRRSHFFHCWGWSTWADRWRIINENWTEFDDMSLSWDVCLNQLRTARGMLEVCPLVSRAVNIGSMLGTHRGHHPLPFWMGERFSTIPAPRIDGVPDYIESPFADRSTTFKAF